MQATEDKAVEMAVLEKYRMEQGSVDSHQKELTCKALTIFDETSMDFVDCLMVAEYIINHKEIKSFDKKVNNYLMRWKQQHEK